MGIAEWSLAALVAIVVVFVILRPDLWGRRERPPSDGGTAVGVGASGRRGRDDDDHDADGDGGDGGGGD